MRAPIIAPKLYKLQETSESCSFCDTLCENCKVEYNVDDECYCESRPRKWRHLGFKHIYATVLYPFLCQNCYNIALKPEQSDFEESVREDYNFKCELCQGHGEDVGSYWNPGRPVEYFDAEYWAHESLKYKIKICRPCFDELY